MQKNGYDIIINYSSSNSDEPNYHQYEINAIQMIAMLCSKKNNKNVTFGYNYYIDKEKRTKDHIRNIYIETIYNTNIIKTEREEKTSEYYNIVKLFDDTLNYHNEQNNKIKNKIRVK